MLVQLGNLYGSQFLYLYIKEIGLDYNVPFKVDAHRVILSVPSCS